MRTEIEQKCEDQVAWIKCSKGSEIIIGTRSNQSSSSQDENRQEITGQTEESQ